MTTETKLKGALTFSSLIILWMMVMYGNSSQDVIIQERIIDSLSIQCDSLRLENFALDVQNGRYEIAYELFTQRNPKAASQFNDIITGETE
jgi:hypothetical protein